jgi:para-nitrobenzyl esterase
MASGYLPDNLTFASGASASVSGIPDQVQSNVSFTVAVTDTQGASASRAYSVNIQSSPTVVQTQHGAVQGVATSNGLYAFRGIPYAAPPVGNLRWKDPQAPSSWKGVRDASTFGNVCAQINFNGRFVGNEDCLFLNVFVSQTPATQSQPVMFFIHGGGNVAGDTISAPFDSPALANQGVVVVTVEYRLGMLGFFAHPLLAARGKRQLWPLWPARYDRSPSPGYSKIFLLSAGIRRA